MDDWIIKIDNPSPPSNNNQLYRRCGAEITCDDEADARKKYKVFRAGNAHVTLLKRHYVDDIIDETKHTGASLLEAYEAGKLTNEFKEIFPSMSYADEIMQRLARNIDMEMNRI